MGGFGGAIAPPITSSKCRPDIGSPSLYDMLIISEQNCPESFLSNPHDNESLSQTLSKTLEPRPTTQLRWMYHYKRASYVDTPPSQVQSRPHAANIEC